MNYLTKGNILTPDVLQGIAAPAPGDRHSDAKSYGYKNEGELKQAISRAYSECATLYTLYKTRLEAGTLTASRALDTWVIDLLRVLGYDPVSATPVPNPLTGGEFRITHRHAPTGMPLHLEPTTSLANPVDLDRAAGNRQSAHNHLQDYLNATEEQTYGLLCNGLELRLLRDASRLSKASYVAWNLAKIFEENTYSDFVVLFRALHVSRFPQDNTEDARDKAAIEHYHKLSLESGSRIRSKLSDAIESGLRTLGRGLVAHPANAALVTKLDELEADAPGLAGRALFQDMLRAIYRILFLAVIEERKLTHPEDSTDSTERDIYYTYYSLQRLRTRVTKYSHAIEPKSYELWADLVDFTFALYEEKQGGLLGLPPLGTGIWAPDQLQTLRGTRLYNRDFMEFMLPLCQFENEAGQLVTINYGSLDVEELGSIYEGLLEREGKYTRTATGQPTFTLGTGTDRKKSGSHYTPEDLVKPLLQHSLDHLIEGCLRQKTRDEKLNALLGLRILDPACGSGHILLSAARRLALAVAQVEHGQEQPTDRQTRLALRRVVATCIYGIDINPMALELARMALWLETHDPGKPLSFLDHHLVLGDSLVGLVHAHQLNQPIADAAYKALPGDDKTLATQWRKRNSQNTNTLLLGHQNQTQDPEAVARALRTLRTLREDTPADVEIKAQTYAQLQHDRGYRNLVITANLLVAPWFIPKKEENKDLLYASQEVATFKATGNIMPDRSGGAMDLPTLAHVSMVARKHRFLHWFITFADVMADGGFDLVVGNPPFMGGQKLSGTLGDNYLNCIIENHQPIGAVDLVAFFFRKAAEVIGKNRFLSFISTNTIAQGKTREGGLDVLANTGYSINHAVRSMPWPGVAAVEVALVTVFKGKWPGRYVLGGKEVAQISPYLSEGGNDGNPYPLAANADKSFQGSIVLGKGFVLEPYEAQALLQADPRNADVIFPYLNGDDLNSRPDQSPSRYVINFFDWPLRRMNAEEWQALPVKERDKIEERILAEKTIALAPPDHAGPVAADYPLCLGRIERLVKPERDKINRDARRIFWWQFAEKSPALYRTIKGMERVMATTLHSKYLAFPLINANMVASHACAVLSLSGNNDFALLKSAHFDNWAWKYSGRMGDSVVRFSPTDAFQTFPFPDDLTGLEAIGQTYYEHRQALMTDLQIGLTKLYNLFHKPALTPKLVLKEMLGKKEPTDDQHGQAQQAVARIAQLRKLHKQMDEAVLAAYGWQDVALSHDFHEVDYLPERDRVRYTISAPARTEILKRLLALNHERRRQEEEQGRWNQKDWVFRKGEAGSKKKGKKTETPLFEG